VTSDTPIPFAAVDSYDTDNMHDTATNNTRVTVKTAGVYCVTFGYGLNYSGTITLEQGQILRNGIKIAYSIKRYSQGTNTANTITTVINASVNDYFEGSIFLQGGSSYTVFAGVDAASTFLSVAWVGTQ
jgi:hypothetical protein